jgi:hypothetical protein
MGKTIEKGFASEDDPLCRGLIIGPVIRSRQTVKEDAGQESHEEPQKDTIGKTLLRKCIEYGGSNDGSQIPVLFALYREWIDKSGAAERLQELQALAAVIEEYRGRTVLALD